MARVGSEIALVGRTAELARLEAVWRQATEGSAGAVLLPGEAGVGKSRLVTELAAKVTHEGGTVLTGHCVGLGDAAPPYLPVVEVLEQVREIDSSLVADAPALATLVARGGTERAADQLQVFDAFLNVLTGLAGRAPVLLVVEDLHWADASTRDLLTFLLARMSHEALAVVLTYRSDELHRRHPLRPMVLELARMRRVERIDLERFGPEETRAFAQALVALDGVERTADDIECVARRSEGNAFFAEELLAHTGENGFQMFPSSPLADVLLGRIEQLGATAQHVVRVAAVAGQSKVRQSTLAAVSGLNEDDLERALRECVQRYVLVVGEDGALAFRHSLLREAVYADLLPGERARTHAAFVRLLGDVRSAGWRGAQAHHATQAGDLPTALVAHIDAAQEAEDVAATADVLNHLEQALALWDAVTDAADVTGTDELTLIMRAADAAVAAGRTERATSYLRSALALTEAGTDPVARAAVLRRLAKVHFAEDQWEAGAQVIAEAWELIRSEPPSRERAWVLSTLSIGAPSPQHRAWVEEAVQNARQVGAGDAEADALISLSYLLLHEAKDTEAMAVLDQARIRAAEVGAFEVELRAHFNLTVGEFERGNVALAAEHARRGLARAREEGLVWATYGRELVWLAIQVLYSAGDWDEAERLASPPGEQAPDWLTGVITCSAALLAASRGRGEEADRYLEAADVLTTVEDEQLKIAAYASAERGLWQQRANEVVAVLQRTVDRVLATENRPPLHLLRIGALGVSAAADVAAQARRRHAEEAEEAAVRAGETFAAVVTSACAEGAPRGAVIGPEGLAWVARCEAETARLRGVDSPSLWSAVVNAFGYGDRYQEAIARWRLAEALLAAGKAPDAAEDAADRGAAELGQALVVARELGAAPLATVLESLARRHRIPVPGVRLVSTDLLTPRERAVLELVAQGLTNRAVGEQLYISEKTVSVHLTRVMAKLGAHSRTDAVARAITDGLIAG
ncbi:helix-turn-helix transcriptional regulator [Ruania halotolerans]|uniref:helix-turn-helix transcriptional regulator n=1 Tax=Ruania halotolerans TaxID=2897773 RepID=UPI001E604F31|nr:helix-turn-helix transcriptional regulator [Ruania halotolerans]UFU07067.1 AAA family ATPase [Ruania halotolerans]